MSDPHQEPSLTMTIFEAAKLLGIGHNLAYDAARRGELPVIKIGGKMIVVRRQLEELIVKSRSGLQFPPPPSDVSSETDERSADIQTSVADLPAIESAVTDGEPKIARADSDGLLNLDYILANASKFKRVSAIYFLTSAQEIIYIGQAIDVYARVSQHVFEGTKRFTRVFMVHCEPSDLNRLERSYIRKFRPRYNYMHNVISDSAREEASEAGNIVAMEMSKP